MKRLNLKQIKDHFWLLLLLSLLFLLPLSFHLYAGYQSRVTRAKEPGQIVKIEPQLGLGEIARTLKEKGIIRSPLLFQCFAYLGGSATQLKAGEYAFPSGISFLEVLRKLEKGDIFHHTVTIPEGETMYEIARYLDSLNLADSKRFLQLCHDQEILRRYGIKARNLEGYLFPDTYYLLKGTKEEEIIDRMVKRFFQVFTSDHERWARRSGLSRHQAVTLASLIEAETPSGDERYLVSSVFHRRLKIGMALQCDPTVIYALSGKEGTRRRLTRRDLAFRSPYNTYLHRGLPPGPICNPGAASLRAALAPAHTSYLYFVSKGNGTHHFSSTLAEHYRAIRKYQPPPVSS
ncbi:MAG: endolytic transglycosylase MltG [candidate division NC10 bacterium]|nr:endolytic transglycosylase MltG [candidate division NC10 bacterium]